jgi:hypothetical protein
MDTATINLIATLILVAITVWYAYSTAQILGEMKRQADTAREQSVILAKSAQVAALTALLNAAAHPVGEEPIPRLRSLFKELEEFISDQVKSTQNSP